MTTYADDYYDDNQDEMYPDYDGPDYYDYDPHYDYDTERMEDDEWWAEDGEETPPDDYIEDDRE